MKMHCMDLTAEHTGYPDLFFGSAGPLLQQGSELTEYRFRDASAAKTETPAQSFVL